MAPPTSPVRTVGHGTLAEDELVALVRRVGVKTIVDVRRYPGSRRHPQYQREAMERWLPAAGLGYRWLPSLGGRRRPDPDSPNTALRNLQFRGYADHMVSEEFRAGLAELLDVARASSVAIMCAESLWWRCHRRLVADHLVRVERMDVEHLFHTGRLAAHDPMPQARVRGDHLVYTDAPEV
jgi:uncharacterized protein (DUF488 family)